MKLTREQRRALFDGDPPQIRFPAGKPCPVEVGHVEALSAHVKLEVTEIRRTKKGEWTLGYTLFNNRLGQRFLAVQDGQVHPEQYTHSGGSAVDPEAGEAVDDLSQRRFTQRARNEERQAAADLVVAAEDVLSAMKERAESHPHFKAEAGLTIHRVRRELDRFIQNQRRKAA